MAARVGIQWILMIVVVVCEGRRNQDFFSSPSQQQYGYGQNVFAQQRGNNPGYAPTYYAPQAYGQAYGPINEQPFSPRYDQGRRPGTDQRFASTYDQGYAPRYDQGYAPGHGEGYAPAYGPSYATSHDASYAPAQVGDTSMGGRGQDVGDGLSLDFSALTQVATIPEFKMDLSSVGKMGDGIGIDLSKVDSLGQKYKFDKLIKDDNFGSSFGDMDLFGSKLDTIGKDIPKQMSGLSGAMESALMPHSVVEMSEMGKLKDVGKFTDFADFKPEFRSQLQGGNVHKRQLCTHPEMNAPSVTGMIKSVTALNFSINIETHCPLPFTTPYRPIDGSCGHPDNLGAINKPLKRLLPPQYTDGQQTPKMFGVSGRPLPSPRLVSRNLHTDVTKASSNTIMLMQWGQIMDHEMVSTPLPIEDTRDVFTCCGPNKTLPLGNEDPECFPILFHGDDNFIGQCMEFVRSMPVKDDFDDVKLPRENMNMVTSFIDASAVYGNTEALLEELRDNHGRGFLFRLDDGRPVDNGKDDCIKREGMDDICYLAGDERVNEHPGLAAIHTILMRQHNLWAQGIRDLAPWMTDEVVFQKTRSIVQAVMQKILFNDWLTIILGEETVVQAGLYVRPGEYTTFDDRHDPRIFQAFSSAVFRFGHTLIPKEFFIGKSRQKLRDLFFKPYLLFENFDDICINLVTGFNEDDRAQDFDRFITEEVTDHLFENEEGQGMGFDLIALNLQRARDHGLGSYNDYRELCGLHRIGNWTDAVWGDSGKLFGTVYEHPDDVELFSGGINERPAKGGFIGETFNCLFVKQMQSVKFGDQFFFSHYRNGHGFTPKQLQEITNYSLSHMMCDNTKMKQIQPNALVKPGRDNPIISCDEYKKTTLNLEHFVFNT